MSGIKKNPLYSASSNLFRHQRIYLTWAKWQLSPQSFHFTLDQEKEKKNKLIKSGGKGMVDEGGLCIPQWCCESEGAG